MIGKLIRPKLIKANAVKGLFFRNNELETEESIKIGNILKGFITQSSSIIKATVLTLSEDCFEISCNCYGTSTSANKDINNCHLLCTWKVKRTFHDSETCLRSVKDLVRDNTFLNLCLSKADIVQLREFIEQLQSMKSLPIVVQDFWTENFYDFVASEDFGQKNSTLSEENFVAKSIFVSTLVISSGVLVAYAVGFLSFIIRVSSLPIQIGILPSLNEKILDAFSLLSHLQTAIKVILLLSAFLATFHRLLGLVVGLYVRNLLGWTQNNGKFDINIDWIALRIGWDKNQILFSGIVWKNPPRFKSTPCFISIKELTVTISSQYVYRALLRQNSAEESIVIDEVVIDNAHIYIEKTSRKEDGLNLWAAFGAENVEDEKKCSGGLMSFLSSAGNMTVGAFSSTASVGINAVAAGADLGLKAVSATANAGLSAVNATAAAGSAAVSATADVGKMALSTTKDIGSSIGSTLYSTTSFLGIRRKEKAEVIPAVAAPALATPTKVVESNNNNDRDKDDDEDDNLEESPWRDVADAPGFGEEEAAEKKETTLEINRVLLINVNLHAQDFLNAQHTEVDSAPSIVIKIMSMFRDDMTLPPKEQGGFIRNLMGGKAKKGEDVGDGRIGISTGKAIGRILNALVAHLFATNNVTMLRIITMATASQTLSLVTDAASTTVNGVVGAVNGVGSVVSSAASVAGAVGKSASHAVIGNRSS